MDKRERFKTFIVIFILSAVYILVFSGSGLLERRELKNKNEQLNEQIENLKNQNSRILKEYEKYRTGIFSSSDIINSGFISGTGKLMYIDERGVDSSKVKNTNKDEFMLSIEHLRIIWIIISIMYITYYFMKNKKSEESTDGSDFN